MCEKVNHCVNLPKLLDITKELIEEHIEPFMHFRHITDKNEATVLFLKENGWLIREMFCKKGCPFNCDVWELTIKFGKLKHKEVKGNTWTVEEILQREG